MLTGGPALLRENSSSTSVTRPSAPTTLFPSSSMSGSHFSLLRPNGIVQGWIIHVPTSSAALCDNAPPRSRIENAVRHNGRCHVLFEPSRYTE
eukprot:CAMPEP_0179465082 /NCGR_PEP_ID=MMETSP0799-20121207/46746_1 /TAXON_ID=46947 /ORGANISM="Geminigera cryophila, Strain CCMP2564" /LENGTH=92 /DNA_ID=CAMNT_0021269205 /DNA_START=113 /DNA_END=391 /DNA_ORIENTATION=-